jgi:hypothetical protein
VRRDRARPAGASRHHDSARSVASRSPALTTARSSEDELTLESVLVTDVSPFSSSSLGRSSYRAA